MKLIKTLPNFPKMDSIFTIECQACSDGSFKFIGENGNTMHIIGNGKRQLMADELAYILNKVKLMSYNEGFENGQKGESK